MLPGGLTVVNGTLFFSLDAGLLQLWKSDGTGQGTVSVKEIPDSGSGRSMSLANRNGALFFFIHANDGSDDRDRWSSDGTAEGTIPSPDFGEPGGAPPPDDLTDVNGTLFFAADDGVNGVELWKSDGTGMGTVLVRDILSGGAGSMPAELTDVNGTLFFTADDGTSGAELWKSDGTAMGTVLVKDIRTGSTGSSLASLTDVDGTLFFTAKDGVTGGELWKSDGTVDGTVLVKDIWSSDIVGNFPPTDLVNVNGTLFFAAVEPVNGQELWKSDGTEQGTVLVKDIRGGNQNSSPDELVNVNGTLFFKATDGVKGFELWKSDGTVDGTVMVKDIIDGAGSSSPSNLTTVNGTLFFNATDGVNGVELWKSDGTVDGTVLVKNIRAGSGSSSPANMVNVNGTLFFTDDDGTNGVELWKSDGTVDGTVLVKDIQSGGVDSAPGNLIGANGKLYFTADDGVNGVELWKSDGTEMGTVLTGDITGDANSATPSSLTVSGGSLFFAASREDVQRELFGLALAPESPDPIHSLQAYLKASNTGTQDIFGHSVAISGNTAIVGAPFEDSNATGVNGDQNNDSILASGAAYIFVRDGATWTQQAYLKASNTGTEDQFGYSVSISGNTVIVGAPFEDSNATGVNGDQNNDNAGQAGAAYVFVRNGTTWTQQAYLKGPVVEPFTPGRGSVGGADSFGLSVSISGDTVVVGAPSEDSDAAGINGDPNNDNLKHAGSAFVFVRNGTVWTQQAFLKASNPGIDDNFGGSVAISGNTAIVGAYGEGSDATGVNGDQNNDNAANSGAAYVFTRDGTTWTQQAYLKASNTETGAASDSFGYSVAISGNTAIVGAPFEGSNATGVNGDQDNDMALGAGAAYVFVRNNTTWTQQAYLKASNTGADDQFGRSVGISFNTAMVGAYYEASNSTGINGDQDDDGGCKSLSVNWSWGISSSNPFRGRRSEGERSEPNVGAPGRGCDARFASLVAGHAGLLVVATKHSNTQILHDPPERL